MSKACCKSIIYLGNDRLEWRKHPGHPKIQFYMKKVVFGDFRAVLEVNGQLGRGVRTASKSKILIEIFVPTVLRLNTMYQLWV